MDTNLLSSVFNAAGQCRLRPSASNMNGVLVLTLSVLSLALPHESASGFPNVYPKLRRFHLDQEDAGAPLFLTPLIENGKIDEARAKAGVQHKEMDDINSYSGYLTVNKKYNSNLFFWFFPATVSNAITYRARKMDAAKVSAVDFVGRKAAGFCTVHNMCDTGETPAEM